MNPQGAAAEEAALHWLQQQGLTLVTRNFQTKTGEIDLIFQEGETLVFVEVRFRASTAYGGAVASITPAKQKKLLKTAAAYLMRYGSHPPPCRIDILAFEGTQIAWIKNALETS